MEYTLHTFTADFQLSRSLSEGGRRIRQIGRKLFCLPRDLPPLWNIDNWNRLRVSPLLLSQYFLNMKKESEIRGYGRRVEELLPSEDFVLLVDDLAGMGHNPLLAESTIVT